MLNKKSNYKNSRLKFKNDKNPIQIYTPYLTHLGDEIPKRVASGFLVSYQKSKYKI